MATPSQRFNILSGRAMISLAKDSQIATKQFTIENNTLRSGVFSVLLTSGATGLNRRRMFIRAIGEQVQEQPTVFIGAEGVTDEDGYPLYTFDEIVLDVDSDTDVYAAAFLDPEESTDVSIMEIE